MSEKKQKKNIESNEISKRKLIRKSTKKFLKFIKK